MVIFDIHFIWIGNSKWFTSVISISTEYYFFMLYSDMCLGQSVEVLFVSYIIRVLDFLRNVPQMQDFLNMLKYFEFTRYKLKLQSTFLKWFWLHLLSCTPFGCWIKWLFPPFCQSIDKIKWNWNERKESHSVCWKSFKLNLIHCTLHWVLHQYMVCTTHLNHWTMQGIWDKHHCHMYQNIDQLTVYIQ